MTNYNTQEFIIGSISKYVCSRFLSRVISVSILLRLRPGRPEYRCSITGGCRRFFSLPHLSHFGSTQPTVQEIMTAPSSRVKLPVQKLIPNFHVIQCYECVELYHHFPHVFILCCLSTVLHVLMKEQERHGKFSNIQLV